MTVHDPDLHAAAGLVGVVAIGRNEGERLSRCLASVVAQSAAVVYVDSASTDDSLQRARALGVGVVELDMSRPFSAGRARNEGFWALLAEHPGLRFVQFVDGDCELAPGWIDEALRALEADPGLAIACGRRRECFPGASPYNRLCDIEWDTPVGEADACGGDFLARVEAFEAVRGFDPTVIAGEEPELCFRLRAAGWRIRRLDAEMTLHDAAIMRFGQWWKRVRRGGYAYALVSALHWRGTGGFRVRNVVSILAWGLALPAGVLALALAHPGFLALLPLSYALQFLRVRSWLLRERGLPARDAGLYALAVVTGKFAEAAGMLQCWRDLLLRRERRIIEYK